MFILFPFELSFASTCVQVDSIGRPTVMLVHRVRERGERIERASESERESSVADVRSATNKTDSVPLKTSHFTGTNTKLKTRHITGMTGYDLA